MKKLIERKFLAYLLHIYDTYNSTILSIYNFVE